MGLQRYRQKRDFTITPEPRGGEGARAVEGLRFVVQKHAASSLHFDFRLELDGVLKSWAVPRDLGDETAGKRLAMHTEDHPLEYADFEGDIPKGQYGGGHMDIWDRGTWIPEGSALASFRRGSLKFELKGKRLKGRWALVRMGNASTRKKDLWLLVKRSDAADAKPRAASRTPRAKVAREGDARR
jgi:bifunctional non-homologous end joining protein LigD